MWLRGPAVPAQSRTTETTSAAARDCLSWGWGLSPRSPRRPEGCTHHGSGSAPLSPLRARFIPAQRPQPRAPHLHKKARQESSAGKGCPGHWRHRKYGSGGRKLGRKTAVKGAGRQWAMGGRSLKLWASAEHDLGLVDVWADASLAQR